MAATCGAITAAGSSSGSLPGYASNFLGFVQLASITMLLKQF
jgi:hypothetical protein